MDVEEEWGDDGGGFGVAELALPAEDEEGEQPAEEEVEGEQAEIEVEQAKEEVLPPWRAPPEPKGKGRGKGKGKLGGRGKSAAMEQSLRHAQVRALEPSAQALTEHEIFVERKRVEADRRDATCKAVCVIKRGLRQPGAQKTQKDGKPFVPAEWDEKFKPVLGAYLKFLLSRPDQFRVAEGRMRGLYTVENVKLNKTVKAPVWDKGKGKGKDKGFDKGKGKAKGDGKGKFKSKGKFDKGFDKGKGKGKLKGKLVKGKAKGRADSFAAPPARAVNGSLRIAPLVAEASAEGGEEPPFDEEPQGEAEDEFDWFAEAGVAAEQGPEEWDEVDVEVEVDEEAEAAAAEAGAAGVAEGSGEPEDAEEDDEFTALFSAPHAKASGHGSFIRSMLGGGLFTVPPAKRLAR